MRDMQQKEVFQDPKVILQTAIEELKVFTQSAASRLEVGEDGRLVEAKESRLERIVGLARCYIGPLFSDALRQEQEKRLLEVKKAILKARDIIQSHSALIEKFKEGDEAQRKLAESALLTIQHYNAIVAQDSFDKKKYNYERKCLLSDQEIKGQKIELPHVISVQYNSHPDSHPAHKMLKELSQALHKGAHKKTFSALTHQESLQVMIDAFHTKAIMMIEEHLKKSKAEIVPLVKQNTPDIDEESQPDVITMRQLIEVDAGSVICVTGCFNRIHSKFMIMPIKDSFRLSFQFTHTGFPYPSQHTGWALADKWIDASPLRMDQTPLFQKVNERRNRLAHQLLFDQTFIQKARRHFKMKRDVFDQNRHIFLPLYRQLQQALQQGAPNGMNQSLLEAFYQELERAPSAFDLLAQTQQQVVHLFIKQPMKALQDEWLEAEKTPLRIGLPQERFQAASQRLEQHGQQAQKQLDCSQSLHAYILEQGLLLSKAFQSVGLQYQSEKMGFSPPLLNDFERKLQACAFQQLLAFLDECEQRIDSVDPAQIKSDLLIAWSKDLHFLESNNEEDHALSLAIVNELERYFTSRFYNQINNVKSRL